MITVTTAADSRAPDPEDGRAPDPEDLFELPAVYDDTVVLDRKRRTPVANGFVIDLWGGARGLGFATGDDPEFERHALPLAGLDAVTASVVLRDLGESAEP